MANKILFIDGQVFQSAAWDRGMGKYSLALLDALVRQKDFSYIKTYIVFTKDMELPPKAEKLIKKAAPNAQHIFADLKVPFDPCQVDIAKLQKVNEEVIDQVVLEYSQPDEEQPDYLIPSLFIDQVCSVFPTNTRNILLTYDLIPLQYSDRYSKLCTFKNYLGRYKTLFEADIILTISQTVADDVAMYLGIPSSKIFNIDGAPIQRSGLVAKEPSVKLPKHYILMPSGDDIRKNNKRAVQGFELYRREHPDRDTALVITSFFDDKTRHELGAYSNNLIFTGNVSEEELVWLYQNTEALLFVPEYEGLGLPVLEAAELNKPIACSNLTVFNEISPNAFYYSDPFDPSSIAMSLTAAIGGSDLAEKTKLYPKILKRYTWANSAKKALIALQSFVPISQPNEKVRLAILAPTPAGYSAIGKLIMQLHPAMSQYFEVDYYLEQSKGNSEFTRPNYLPSIARVLPVGEFNKKRYKQYDAVLYHIGNSEFHAETVKNALYLPGYAVFHDTHLANIFKDVLEVHGYITQDRLKAEATLDKLLGNSSASYVGSLANNQKGLIVHSEYAKDALKKSCLQPSTPILKVNLPTATPQQVVHKLEGEHLTIGLAGIIHPAKGLDIIETIAQSDRFLDCKIHIFGLPLVGGEVIQRLEAYPNVVVNTDVTDFQFQTMLSKVDILVNFRSAYRGETSLATIEAMRFGVIPVVKKVGWYDELPEDSVVKVSSQDELMTALESLIIDQNRQDELKRSAKELIAKQYNYEIYARSLYELMTQERTDNLADRTSVAIKEGSSLRSLTRRIRQQD